MARRIDPSELSIEEKLKALYELQLVDSKIDSLRVLQGELPQEVKDMADEVEGLRTRRDNIEADIKQCELKISEMRVKIDMAKAAINKLKDQQNNVRNNREFDAISKEIEYNQLEIELCEKRINENNEVLERKTAEKTKTVSEIEERTSDLNQKQAELNDILAETKEQTETLMIRAGKLEGNIEDRLLAAFKRLRKNARNGLAVVTVEHDDLRKFDACGGCHNRIPAQRQLDIRLRKKIIPCEYCGRILIDPDLAAEVKPVRIR